MVGAPDTVRVRPMTTSKEGLGDSPNDHNDRRGPVIGKSYWSVFARPGFFQIWIEFPSVNLDLGELFSTGRCGKGRSGHSRPDPSQQFLTEPGRPASTRSGRQITRPGEFQATQNALPAIAARPNLRETRQLNDIDVKNYIHIGGAP